MPPLTRKIQKTGTVSLSITLPKKWIKAFDLKQGDELLITQSENGDLIIHAPKKEQQAKPEMTKTIPIHELQNEKLMQTLISAYLKGYKNIKITSEDPIPSKTLRKIEKAVENFIGLELVESTRHEIHIHDLSKPILNDMNRFIKRMNRIVLEMLHDTITGFASKDVQLLQDVTQQEKSVDKLYYLLSRQLRSFLHDLAIPDEVSFSLSNIIDVERIIKRLEGLADHCFRLAKLTIADTENKRIPDVPNDLWQTASNLETLFRDTMRAFFLKDSQSASTLIAKSHEHRDWIWNQIISFNKDNMSILYNFLRLLERVTNYIADIGEATINVFS